MKVIHIAYGDGIPKIEGKAALALGYFDGMHRGHQALLSTARSYDGEYGALLHDVSPRSILKGQDEVLCALEDKLRILEKLDASFAYVLKTDEALLQVIAEEYEKNVIDLIAPSKLYVGSDFTYGLKAQGNAETLKARHDVEVIALLEEGGEKISSTSIREALTRGDIEKANRFLGRPYEMKGTVAEGFKNGRKIGFPTANLQTEFPYILPKTGVYYGICYSRGRPYPSIINVGNNPTVGKLDKPLVECHLDGLKDEIYGETLYVDFLGYIRDEKKFSSLEELGNQLREDLSEMKKRMGA